MKLSLRARKLVFTVATLLLFAGLAEGILMLAGFEPPDPGYFRRDARMSHVLDPGVYPDDIRVNEDGFRGPDLLEWRPGRVRIVTLGDSCTFGVNVGEGSRIYPRRLERLLRDQGMNAEVVNAGVPGYTSYQGRLLIPRLERLRPEAITIYYGWNDHWLGGFLPDGALAPYPLLTRLYQLASGSRIYQALKGVFRKSRRPAAQQAAVVPLALGDLLSGAETYRVPIEAYEQNLEAIVAWAQGQGIRVIIVTAPAGIDHSGRIDDVYRRQGFIKASDNVASLHAAYNDRARAVAEKNGIKLVDAAEIFRRHGSDFFLDPVVDPAHPNAAGHALIAEALAEVLGNLLPRETPEGARASTVDQALRRAGDWYLKQGGELVCTNEAMNRSDAKYMWFLWQTADLTGDFALKRLLMRIMNSCGRVDARYEIYDRLLPPGVHHPSFGLGAQVALGIHEDAHRWAVNCDRYTLGDGPRARLFGTRYAADHAGNRLNRKSYGLTHMLLTLIWLKQTEPSPGACVDPEVLENRMRELANRLAWEQYTGLDNLGGYDGTRRRAPGGGVRYAMQDITGQRIGAILAAGYPDLVRPEWLDHLVASQNEDGGWSANEGGPSSRHTTMCAMWALAQARHTHARALGYAR